MIDWLIQTTAAHPNLGQGIPPRNLLSDQEAAVFDNLKIAKRKKDWLLGRWTCKQLLQQVIYQESGEWLPFEAFSILAGDNGAPAVHFDPPFEDWPNRFSISISHSNGTAFCAAVSQENWPLGADLERIESRCPGFAENYFTESELELLSHMPGALKDLQITALWSAKEAAFKAVREGLRLDTRQVECRFAAIDINHHDWVPFSIDWCGNAVGQFPALQGWWKTAGEYVLTLAVAAGQETEDVAENGLLY